MSEIVEAEAKGGSDPLAVYSRRKARMIFLRRRVEEGNPIIGTERQLVEMARSKLLEGLLAQHGESGLLTARPEITARIRAAMLERASDLTSDAGVREQILADIGSDPLDDLFRSEGL